MGKYKQEEEVEIVKYCRDLTATIQLEERELDRLKGEKFKDKPNSPVRKTAALPNNITPQYPPKPRAQYGYTTFVKELFNKYWWAFAGAAVLLLIFLIIGCVDNFALTIGIFFGVIIWFLVAGWFALTVVFWKRKRRHLDAELSKTPEYLQAVARAEAIASEQQKEAESKAKAEQVKYDEEYEKEKLNYELVVLPQYDKELAAWTGWKNSKIEFLKEEILLNKEALDNMYNTTKLMSSTYRDLNTLMWIYEDMSTSDHDIRYATELYDRDRQRAVTEAAGLAVRQAVYNLEETMKSGFEAVYEAIEYGNALDEEQISILSKTRRDQNIANIVGIAQHYRQNKMFETVFKDRLK